MAFKRAWFRVFCHNLALESYGTEPADDFISRVLVFLSRQFSSTFFVCKNYTMIWNRNSNNPAHVLLEQMFKENKILPTTLPGDVYNKKENEEFRKFTLPVFRTVFNELKAKYGLPCK